MSSRNANRPAATRHVFITFLIGSWTVVRGNTHKESLLNALCRPRDTFHTLLACLHDLLSTKLWQKHQNAKVLVKWFVEIKWCWLLQVNVILHNKKLHHSEKIYLLRVCQNLTFIHHRTQFESIEFASNVSYATALSSSREPSTLRQIPMMPPGAVHIKALLAYILINRMTILAIGGYKNMTQ